MSFCLSYRSNSISIKEKLNYLYSGRTKRDNSTILYNCDTYKLYYLCSEFYMICEEQYSNLFILFCLTTVIYFNLLNSGF